MVGRLVVAPNTDPGSRPNIAPLTLLLCVLHARAGGNRSISCRIRLPGRWGRCHQRCDAQCQYQAHCLSRNWADEPARRHVILCNRSRFIQNEPFVYIQAVKPRTKFLIVVEGRLGRDNTFRATTLLAKCASRYENAPEKYKNTPGYKRAEQRA
jgi:hypothetical protein